MQCATTSASNPNSDVAPEQVRSYVATFTTMVTAPRSALPTKHPITTSTASASTISPEQTAKVSRTRALYF